MPRDPTSLKAGTRKRYGEHRKEIVGFSVVCVCACVRVCM